MTETKEADFKKEMRAVALMERRVAEALRDKEQFRRYIVTEKRGGDTSTEEYVLGKVDFKAMGEALKTVKQLV